MIGQIKLIETLTNWKTLPRFIILEGSKGVGKKTFAKEIAKKFNLDLIIIGTKIDEIRGMITLANQSDSSLLFLIDEGDKMSLGAKNTLLKVTEEAPNKVYIILTTENKALLLPTLNSRAEILRFTDYDLNDHIEFCKENNIEFDKDKANVFPEAFPNLSYHNKMTQNEAIEFHSYCSLILKSIRVASGSNAFKIIEKLKIKEEDEGWELNQFLYCLSSLSNKIVLDSALLKNKRELDYQIEVCKVLNKLKKMLTNPIYNRNYIVDSLILDLKSIGG